MAFKATKWKLMTAASGALVTVIYLAHAQPPGLVGESQNGDGVFGMTESPAKSGVYGFSPRGVGVTGRGDEQPGVVGWTGSADASGVMGHSTEGRGVVGRSDGNDGVVGWSGSPDRSGVFGHSGMGIGVTGRSEGNDGVLAVSTSPNEGHAAIRARNEGSGPAAFIEGDLFVTGAIRGDKGPHGGASYPQPAFVSGWQAINFSGVPIGLDSSIKINHNVGGNPENYVVDLQFRSSTLGINQRTLGGTSRVQASLNKNNVSNGGWWSNLTGQSITVWRGWSDKEIAEVRVRIWVYM